MFPPFASFLAIVSLAARALTLPTQNLTPAPIMPHNTVICKANSRPKPALCRLRCRNQTLLKTNTANETTSLPARHCAFPLRQTPTSTGNTFATGLWHAFRLFFRTPTPGQATKPASPQNPDFAGLPLPQTAEVSL